MRRYEDMKTSTRNPAMRDATATRHHVLRAAARNAGDAFAAARLGTLDADELFQPTGAQRGGGRGRSCRGRLPCGGRLEEKHPLAFDFRYNVQTRA